MTHWSPYNRNGEECRFCSNPPFPPIRNSKDVADWCVCFDARLPPFYLKLSGLVYGLDRMARSL